MQGREQERPNWIKDLPAKQQLKRRKLGVNNRNVGGDATNLKFDSWVEYTVIWSNQESYLR